MLKNGPTYNQMYNKQLNEAKTFYNTAMKFPF